MKCKTVEVAENTINSQNNSLSSLLRKNEKGERKQVANCISQKRAGVVTSPLQLHYDLRCVLMNLTCPCQTNQRISLILFSTAFCQCKIKNKQCHVAKDIQCEFGGLSHCGSSGECKYSHFTKSVKLPLRQ